MKIEDITVGKLYRVDIKCKSTLTGFKTVIVRVNRIGIEKRANRYNTNRFDVTNLSTGRKTTLRSAVRFIEEIRTQEIN